MREQIAQRKGDFRAVSVEFDWRGCCEASRNLAGQRFLPADAPRLPLDACSRPGECYCKYRHWGDRRVDDRRTPYKGRVSEYHAASDRRVGDDRRD